MGRAVVHTLCMEDRELVKKLELLQKQVDKLSDKQQTSVNALFDLIVALAESRGQTATEITDALLSDEFPELKADLIKGLREQAQALVL